ncbi:MFS general substrate transporter [Punctularia strigosozonata HHB-11173 SS5]|uniref:MFS general substrate transporter n=1 Tax=Punctularia strigosozonata (strain HHB-11173) TaxID=741275 RepID=UPI0004416F17|nr:MFS general substrate transporter [Punctularia strigosozonata HHB-11173 SS5]EIN09356.1 MFS general substrate transporter [Punctularia strigosozonata HHB-11173 SS5]
MPVFDLVRESFLGQAVYYASRRRWLQYAEEKPGFELPARYRRAQDQQQDQQQQQQQQQQQHQSTLDVDRASSEGRSTRAPTLVDNTETARSKSRPVSGVDAEKQQVAYRESTKPEEVEMWDDPQWLRTVDWYGPDDPECPMNWSFSKKCFVTFDICFITFSIYIGSAIYSPGIPYVAQDFGVSDVAATLGITMFVIGYGIGPMFLSPLSEIPQFGRTSTYIITLALFVILQVPTALSKNLGALLPLRFLAGFVGSPPLATGGASLADMWGPADRAIAIGLWGCAAVSGPVLGPLLGGFAAQAEGWTWTIWILLWLSGFSLAFLTVLLPETSASAILYRRAVRLRRLTGNEALRSHGELEAEHFTAREVAMMTLVRPFVLGFTEPIVAAWNVYIALLYGILYIWISSYEIIFVEIYGFNLGENGLAFMGLFLGAIIAFALLVPYVNRYVRPKFANGEENFPPEARLPPALVGAILLPLSLFWFGWTSRASIHWIVPIIATLFYSIGTFFVFQAGLNYLQDCYPRHVASVFAGNDLFRSCLGAAFPIFASAFFRNLGVGKACSVLGGISVAMIPIPVVLWKYGPKIRAMSKYSGFKGPMH